MGKALIPTERIERSILLIRGQKVLLDSDLAELYGVTTKVLNQSVSRNRDRFPADFMFRLSAREKSEVVTNCDHLAKLKYSPTRPYVFTEQGVAMLSSVLRSPRAVQVNVEIMRAFVRLRQIFSTHADLAKKLDELEQKYDEQFKVVFDALRELMSPPERKKRPPIGFHTEERLRRV